MTQVRTTTLKASQRKAGTRCLTNLFSPSSNKSALLAALLFVGFLTLSSFVHAELVGKTRQRQAIFLSGGRRASDFTAGVLHLRRPKHNILMANSMLTTTQPEVTQLLLAWSNGDEEALASLAPLVQHELRKLARRYLSHERPGHTLQPSDLVNEAYLRLIDSKTVQWQNRAHFFGIASQVMRRILVDHARRRNELKRGGGTVQVSLAAAENLATARNTDVLALDEALCQLATFDLRKSQIVELRFFGGLSESETAEVMKISLRTIQREWNLARAGLYQQLSLEGMQTS